MADEYKELTVQEREKTMLALYKEFDDKFLKEYKNLSKEEFEHLRHEYIDRNFYLKLNLKNKK